MLQSQQDKVELDGGSADPELDGCESTKVGCATRLSQLCWFQINIPLL